MKNISKKLLVLLALIIVNQSALFQIQPTVTAQEVEDQVYSTRATALKTIKVLAIGYNPTEIINGTPKDIVSTYFDINLAGKTVPEYEDASFAKFRKDMNKVTNKTYKFEIVKKLNFDKFVPALNGDTMSIEKYSKCLFGKPGFDPAACDRFKQNFDYKTFIQTNQICEIAAANKINEIWVLSPSYFLAWEALMVGPSEDKMHDTNGKNVVVPSCIKAYPIVNPTYDRPDGFVHSYGHRIEGTIKYFSENWIDNHKAKHVEKDLVFKLYSTNHGISQIAEKCGNIHYPSNTISEYKFDSTVVLRNTCDRWHDFPKHRDPTPKFVNCTEWGCSEFGWDMYWLKHVPSRSGQLAVVKTKNKGKILVSTNWWDYILNPKKTVKLVNNPTHAP